MKNIDQYIPGIIKGIRIYYDRGLQKYKIGWAQQFLLEYIYTNPGIHSQTLTDTFYAEKSTISKGLKRLYEEGYIRIESDTSDHRSKKIYATEKADEVIKHIRHLQTRLHQSLEKNFSEQELSYLKCSLERLQDNLRAVLLTSEEDPQDE